MCHSYMVQRSLKCIKSMLVSIGALALICLLCGGVRYRESPFY